MYRRIGDYLAREQSGRWLGVIVSAVGVAIVTLAIYPLSAAMPAVAAGVLYLPVVLVASIGWGFAVGMVASVLSAVAFNFFHIPPTGQFNVARSEDWVALAVFLFTAIVAGALADAARSAVRRQESLQRELIEADAVKRSDELKTALLRSVSHDLRSPLTAIAAAAEALSSPRISDADREQLAADVVAGAERLSNLVGKLLDVARLQADAAPPHADWCSVEEILRTAAEQLPPKARPLIESEDRVPLVRADAAQLERVFWNLLENAERHGGGARSAFIDAENGSVTVRVVDFGLGVPTDYEDRVFEPFVAFGDRRSTTGLGLAIVKGFVEANGGEVRYEPTPGGGATFVVTLPAEEPTATANELQTETEVA